MAPLPIWLFRSILYHNTVSIAHRASNQQRGNETIAQLVRRTVWPWQRAAQYIKMQFEPPRLVCDLKFIVDDDPIVE